MLFLPDSLPLTYEEKESDTVHSRKSVLFAELASTSSKVSVDPDQVALQQDLNEYGAKLFGSWRL